ncbi:hypothetical protein BDV59DRAFT_184336 [Aspergillus ambiguus]|uniref:uncharacterized protein n=1 Tax=Aspergillus ambiguus TaxID=176160 RepID=UPI003CCDA9AB
MSLKDIYLRFLADPKSASLASDVSLIYIPTTTKVDGADAVRSHLTKQDHVLKRKSQDVLDTIEGANSLCLDVESTVEFVSGGGPYLLALDDNFLSDRVATFPTVHIVHFNSQNQIQNVRVYWDQGSLLKQVEVIGARGRVWPLRDAKDQTRLIKSTVASTPAAETKRGPAAPAQAAPTPSLPADQENAPPKRSASPGKRHIKDPYASESLFDLLSPGKDREEPFRAPRAPASAKPPPRDLSEIFVGEEDGDTPDATPSKPRAVAPKVGAGKHYQPSRIFGGDDDEEPASTPVAPKIGAGKNFRASRIFDDDETVRAQEKPEQIAYRAHPKRFEHFELGADNSEREIKPKTTRPLSKQGPQWTFEDFATPEKPRRQPRGEEVRHFGWSDDEPEQDSPPAKPRVVQPRRDAETHFQLTDDIEEPAQGRIISSYGNRGKTLYTNPLYNEEDDELPDKPAGAAGKTAPLSVVHNGPNRRKDFESHWEVTDDIPPPSAANTENQKPIAADRQKAVKMMEASWEASDESPQPNKPQPLPSHRGSMRDANQRSWDF